MQQHQILKIDAFLSNAFRFGYTMQQVTYLINIHFYFTVKRQHKIIQAKKTFIKLIIYTTQVRLYEQLCAIRTATLRKARQTQFSDVAYLFKNLCTETVTSGTFSVLSRLPALGGESLIFGGETGQGVWGSAVSSPSGVWGGAPAANAFQCILEAF